MCHFVRLGHHRACRTRRKSFTFRKCEQKVKIFRESGGNFSSLFGENSKKFNLFSPSSVGSTLDSILWTWQQHANPFAMMHGIVNSAVGLKVYCSCVIEEPGSQKQDSESGFRAIIKFKKLKQKDAFMVCNIVSRTYSSIQ